MSIKPISDLPLAKIEIIDGTLNLAGIVSLRGPEGVPLAHPSNLTVDEKLVISSQRGKDNIKHLRLEFLQGGGSYTLQPISFTRNLGGHKIEIKVDYRLSVGISKMPFELKKN